MSKFSSYDILGEWLIDSLYQGDDAVPLTTTSKFEFYSGSNFKYVISTSEPEDDTTETGVWRFDKTQLKLTLQFYTPAIFNDFSSENESLQETDSSSFEMTYEVIQIAGTSMQWIAVDENEILARIELIRPD